MVKRWVDATVGLLLVGGLVLSGCGRETETAQDTLPVPTTEDLTASLNESLTSSLSNSAKAGTDPGDSLAAYKRNFIDAIDASAEVVLTTDRINYPTRVSYSVGGVYCYSIPITGDGPEPAKPGAGTAIDGTCTTMLETGQTNPPPPAKKNKTNRNR
jgi:hypothetical protein